MAQAYRFTKSIHSTEHSLLVKMLRKAREDARLTQVQAAQRLGCRQTFLSKIESGERRLDLIEFLTLCKAYEASPAHIIKKLQASRRPIGIR